MNEGCIPTKTLLRSSEVNHLVRNRAAEFGIQSHGSEAMNFDLAVAVRRKDTIVDGIIAGIHNNIARNDQIDFITGRAEFTSPVDLRVAGEALQADKIILAIGSTGMTPLIPGLEESGYITNNEALHLKAVPASMIIIGAGYIGVEFAQMYSRFGTKVTLLGRAPRVMRSEEPELSDYLGRLLAREGVDLHTSATVKSAGKGKGQRYVVADIAGKDRRFEAEVLLLAAGRKARLDGLGLGETGIELDGNFIRSNGQLQTSADNIWSLGDANGGAMFTHRAIYDAPLTALNAFKGAGKQVDYRVVPRAVFTEPALASVGLTEKQAKNAGYEVRIGVEQFAGYGRAQAIGETEGVVKIVVDAKTNVILGGHILGPHADMLIHQVAIAMYDHGKLDRLTKTIHVHPTLSEVVKGAAKAAR